MEPIIPSRTPGRLVKKLEKKRTKRAKKRMRPPQNVPTPQKPSLSCQTVRKAAVKSPSGRSSRLGAAIRARRALALPRLAGRAAAGGEVSAGGPPGRAGGGAG